MKVNTVLMYNYTCIIMVMVQQLVLQKWFKFHPFKSFSQVVWYLPLFEVFPRTVITARYLPGWEKRANPDTSYEYIKLKVEQVTGTLSNYNAARSRRRQRRFMATYVHEKVNTNRRLRSQIIAY